MEQIKKYFSNWDTSRIIRLVLAVAFGTGYFFTRETIYLFAAVVLGFQVAFNISCPGGSCATPASKNEKPVVEVKKYEPEKK